MQSAVEKNFIKNLKKGKKIYFSNDTLPYEIKAISEQYAVASRKLSRKEDADLLRHRVEMNAYNSFTEAYNALKDAPVYSLLDFEKGERAPHNLVFGDFNYFKESDCREAIVWLETGKMELSTRNKIELVIDWDRTLGLS